MSVYSKLLDVQSKLKAPKGQYNSFGNYKYRNCEDILEALKPLCKEANVVVFLTDEIVTIGQRYYVKATAHFVDIETDNAEITVTAYAREEENKKGMDGSQVTGASSSYARKYALNGMFDIDDTKDSDATNDGQNNNNASNKSGQTKQTDIFAEINKSISAYSKQSGMSTKDVVTYIESTFNVKLDKSLPKQTLNDILNTLKSWSTVQ
jgi:hypothetical protein